MMKKVKNRLELLEQKKNNRGSAFIITIAAVALLCFMVSVILTLAAYNLQMKATDLKGKKTFYTAETAMDEIRAGLQQDVSEALAVAYMKTMESSIETAISDREAVFQTEFVQQLRQRIADPMHSDKYVLDYLKTFLKKTAYDDVKKIGAKINSVDCRLDLTTAGLVLKDLTVTYHDEQKYLSEIKTDIILQFPDIDFTQGTDTMEFLNYVLIANDRLSFSNGATVQTKGSAYAGKNGAEFYSSNVSFLDYDESDVQNVLITNGNLTNRSSHFNASDIEIWAENLVADSGTTEVKANTFLSNDLVINNSTGGITTTNVTMQGNYYGYGSLSAAKSADSLLGYSTDIEKYPASYSSAILVNGAKANVDISSLSTLMIAGNSYIGASEKNSEIASFATRVENPDVAMGESISIKSNQTAYLVPAECVAPGADNGKTNPMPAAKYNKLLDELDGNTSNLVDLTSTITKNYGVSLSAMGVTGYKTVCYPIANVGSMVYLFMEFDSEASANSFFTRYYSNAANKSKLDSNLDMYTYGIKVPDSMDLSSPNSTFYYNGNIVVNEDSKDSFYVNKLQTVTSQESAEMLEVQKAYYDTFAALGTNLSRDYSKLTPEELLSDVYGNLVENMTGYDASTNKNIPSGTKKVFVTAGTDAVGAVVANGNYTIDTEEVVGIDSEGNTVTADLRVVIASGDVTVKKNFKGMIIAGGQIIVEGLAVNLEAAPAEVAVALSAKDSNDVKPVSYLKGMDDIMLGGNGSGEASDGKVDISDLIVYKNWKKQ